MEQYIKKELGYQDIGDFKADDKVFKVLVESGKGSIEQLSSSINSNTAVVSNVFTVNRSQYEISVDTKIDLDNLGQRGTNFDDFYKVLNKLGVII